MNRRHWLRLAGAASLIATVAAGSATPAAASAPGNGCPSGYTLLPVPALTAEGYHAPALVDSTLMGGLS